MTNMFSIYFILLKYSTNLEVFWYAQGRRWLTSPRWQQEEAGNGQQAARLCPCARAGGVLEAICVQWTEN